MTKSFLKFRSRITIVTCFVILAWCSLSVRLFQIQILNNQLINKDGKTQGKQKEILPASRGNIFDRKNVPLTRNISHTTLVATPDQIVHKSEVSRLLSSCTSLPSSHYFNKLSNSNSYTFLARNILESQCKEISRLEELGVIVKRNYFRHYPFRMTGGQIIGFTDPDNQGLTGIEKQFNTTLTGTDGWIIKKESGTGQKKRDSSYPYKYPRDGAHLQLTIDIEYQNILEDELLKQVNHTNAQSGTGLLMNPETGEILAIASVPGFDPNHPGNSPIENQKIKAITDQFEPGSTFKIVSATVALDNQIVQLKDEFFCENGSFYYNEVKIRDHEKYGLLTFSQVLEQSSNVGIIKITELLDIRSFYQYIKRFGFGLKTNISLPGEAKGLIRETENWSKISPGILSMGQEISVTALQLAMAYSAVANGGFLLKPTIVKQVMDHNRKIDVSHGSNVLRRIASKKTMQSIRHILKKTVDSGTASPAQIPGWDIAGKTGTAQKFINGAYSDTKFISNFVGFFPVSNPQLLCVILIDEPRSGYHWGAIGAAPVFKKVIQRIINMDDSFQNFEIKKTKQLKDIWVNHNQSQSGIVDNPSMLAHTVQVNNEECTVPDVRRMSLRGAVRKLKEHGFSYSIQGSGIVRWQSPKPDKTITCGTLCVIGLH